MAEMLIVVAIVAVLLGVAFVAVNSHQRSLGLLERDAIAKEIFVAAQNHLAVAYGEGYLGLKETDSPNPFGIKDSDEYYYIVVNAKGVSPYWPDDGTGEGIFEQILPFGSIDENVRAGGSYIVRYQKNTGLIQDVFYCTRNSTPKQYNHSFFDGDKYDDVISYAGTAKNKRKNYINGSILGWYGAFPEEEIEIITLKAPKIKIENADRLFVELTDDPYNSSNYSGKYSLKLIITGESSEAQKAITVKVSDNSKEQVDISGRVSGDYSIILDDITNPKLHFSELGSDNAKDFIAGENIKIQAVAYSTECLSNIAKSSEYTENSLFADIGDSDEDDDSVPDIAYIGNIRHLENLDKLVSNLDLNDDPSSEKLDIASAIQIESLDWSSDDGGFWRSTKITAPEEGSGLVAGYISGYYPISPNYPLTYDGNHKSIANITTNSANSGVFGLINSGTVTSIADLELIDFSVSGTDTAGTLAGTLKNCKVTNVLARNSTDAASVNVSAVTAGGLIGSINNSSGYTIEKSAAAVIVNGSSTAGGLIGTASGTISGCYSGGHTKNGSYKEWVAVNPYDVVGGTAGGLVGVADTATVEYSYSTCSAKGTTTAVGGFIGKATNNTSVSNCYSTGIATRDSDTVYEHAFLGSGSLSSSSNNRYYMIINEHIAYDANGNITKIEYLGAGADGITAIDVDDSKGSGGFNSFVGPTASWASADPYDRSLGNYYAGKYNLRTVQELGKSNVSSTDFVNNHHGDWPAPEIFFVNTPAT